MRSDITAVVQRQPPEGPGPHLLDKAADRPFKAARHPDQFLVWLLGSSTPPSVAKAISDEVSAKATPTSDAS
jgi:hypothetical protein